MLRRTPTILLLLALALIAPGAAAASPLSLGPGRHPRVAVSASGRGFFTWTAPSGSEDVFHYCRIQQSAAACDRTFIYFPPSPNNSDVVGGYALLPPGGRVMLLDARCCDFYANKELFTSLDGGFSFSSGLSPGSMNGGGDNIAGQALYAPAMAVGRAEESILTVSDIQTIGVTFQATGTAAGSTTSTANLGGSGGSYQGSLALQGSSTLVATFGTLSPARLYWRKWNGIGDVNDVTNWTAAALLDTTNVNSTAKLVSGPSGLYVAYSTGAVNNERFVLRKFTGSGWGPSLALSEVGNPSNGDLVEDSSGVLHFAWQDAGGTLRYRRARTAANTAFTPSQKVAGPGGNFPFLKLGVNAARHGWVTYEASGIRAIAIPPPYSGPTKTSKTSVGSDRLRLSTPKDCVATPQVFTGKVSAKAKTKGTKVKLKITKVVFSLDGHRLGTFFDKPFNVTVPTAGFAAGSAHELKAKITVVFKKNGHDTTVEKTLTGTFSTC